MCFIPQLAPDYLLSLLVLIFYLRNFNANLDPAADMQDLQESNRPMVLDFVASFVHTKHPAALDVKNDVVQARLCRSVGRMGRGG